MKSMASEIYRSSKKEGFYLFINPHTGFDAVPEDLRQQFGTPVHAMTLTLTPQRKLARADIRKVMEALDTDGYYLQVPPTVSDEMTTMSLHNNKLY